MTEKESSLLVPEAVEGEALVIQREVAEVFAAADQSMSAIDEGCLALHLALDALGARRFTEEETRAHLDQARTPNAKEKTRRK